jgi:CRISPR/Cas system CSM-associated protein Csm2 small subunit|tara:strand:+ start:24 stop:392 length:369 start_codon:yes stop_codon:yes gene_type:complete
MDKSNSKELIVVGRPKKEVDSKILGNLASIGCTIEECASVMGVSARTLRRNYAEIIDQNKEKGKASLRKKMFDKAIKKDNTHMQIWLSKNYLGMKDRTVNENINEPLPLIIEAKVEDVKEER